MLPTVSTAYQTRNPPINLLKSTILSTSQIQSTTSYLFCYIKSILLKFF